MHQHGQHHQARYPREREPPGRPYEQSQYASQQAPQKNPKVFARVADDGDRRVAVDGGPQQLADNVRVHGDAVDFGCATVGRIEEILDTFRRHAHQDDFVFEGAGVEDPVEHLAERECGEGAGPFPVVDQKLVAACVGADIAAVVGFERPKRRRAEADVRGIVGIGRNGDPLGLQVKECGPQGHRVTDALAVIEKQQRPADDTAGIHQHVGESDLLGPFEGIRRRHPRAAHIRKFHGADDLRVAGQHAFELLMPRRHGHVPIDVQRHGPGPVARQFFQRVRQHGVRQRPLPQSIDVVLSDQDDEDPRGHGGGGLAHADLPVVGWQLQILEDPRHPQS